MGRPRYAYVYVRRRHEVAVSIIEASSISHSQTRMLLHGHELMIELPAFIPPPANLAATMERLKNESGRLLTI